MQHSVLSLLDVPLPWLTQLATAQLDKKSKQSLFRTCKSFRDIYLEQSDKVQCQVVSNALTTARAASSLQLLNRCKGGAEVKLVLKDAEVHAEPYGTIFATFTTWMRKLCSHASMAARQPLHHVTCVELQGHVHGDIVPLELVTACPNMTQLIRWGRFATSDVNDFAPVSCSQLQKLTINHVAKYVARHCQISLSSDQLKQQLQSLPNLQHMNCTVSSESGSFSYLVNGIQALGRQLTYLQVQSKVTHSFTMLVTNPWPQLRELQMPSYHMKDTGHLQVLCERAPLLAVLGVRCMDKSTSPVPNPSNNIRIIKVESACLSIFAHFPLSGLETFRFETLVVENEHAQYVPAAAAMLSSTTTKVVTDRKDGALAVSIAVAEEPAPGLASLLHLIPHKSIMLSSAESAASDGWMQLLAELECKHLMVAPQTLPPTFWGTLKQKLSQLHTLELLYQGTGMLSGVELGLQLCTLLAAPPRPFTLQVHAELGKHMGPGWEVRMNAFLQAYGHSHVIINTVDSN